MLIVLEYAANLNGILRPQGQQRRRTAFSDGLCLHAEKAAAV